MYNNNIRTDFEFHKFINSEFRNYRLRLEWPLVCVWAREIVLNANELKVVQLIATPLKKLLFRARLGDFFSPS